TFPPLHRRFSFVLMALWSTCPVMRARKLRSFVFRIGLSKSSFTLVKALMGWPGPLQSRHGRSILSLGDCRLRSRSHPCRFFLNSPPRALYVPSLGVGLPDAKAQREPIVQPRMRKVKIAAAGEAIH